MDKFYALSAPIRREIIAILSGDGEQTATAIAKQFSVSPAAISQHLKVLLNSDLVTLHKQAQQRIYKLNVEAIQELEDWASALTTQLEQISSLTKTETNDQPLTDTTP